MIGYTVVNLTRLHDCIPRCLPDEEWNVIQRLYGYPDATVASVAAELGISRNRVTELAGSGRTILWLHRFDFAHADAE